MNERAGGGLRGEFVVKVPLRIGRVRRPQNQIPLNPAQPRTGKAGRIAGLSAAAAVVLGVGAASALFVDYLADRALARTADEPVSVKPLVAAAVETAAEAKVASIASQPAKPAPIAKEPAAAPIEAAMPEPEAIAKVAIGPEHAIELPADDPTAKPTVKLAAVEPDGEEPLAFADDQAEDGTQTAAIAPEEAVPEATPKPKKPRTAKAAPEAQGTEVASLPGVDIGGLAGHRSGEADASESTVRTVTKPAAKTTSNNLGGVAAGAARVTAAVNMRSGPRKGSSVLTVVPAGSPVQVLSCNGWCQIAYNGRKGFVYKSYLAASKARPQKQAAETAEAAEPARGVQSPRLR